MIRRVARYLIATLALVALLIGITSLVGFPGPGPLRRYPVTDLNALANRINQSAKSGQFSKCLGHEDIATTDLLSSRVVVSSGLPLTLNKSEIEMITTPNGGPVFGLVSCDVGG